MVVKAGDEVFWGNRMKGRALSEHSAVFFGPDGTLYLTNHHAPPGERKFKLTPDEASHLRTILNDIAVKEFKPGKMGEK